ncbi:MAG: glycosyltransferase family 4 protein, partial [Mycobacteriales bacterium]
MGTETAVKPNARIALVLQGDPSSPGTWSGVPASLGHGLEAVGCEVVPIDAEIPAGGKIANALKMSWADRSASRFFAAGSGFVSKRRLRAAGPVDGVVIMGSGSSIATEAPLVTFEDMTVVQARREGGQSYDALSDAAVSRWHARQRRNYERCSSCCAASNWAADSIRDDYGVPDSKIHVVGFGHNIEMEKPSRDWNTPRFLWVGSDWKRKNGAAIVEALRTVRGVHPDATLDLVGAHPEVDAEGVIGHGRLPLGSPQGQREYLDLLRRSTCYVMPSVYEPLGISYIDAATAGIPSIGTTSGGARDAIDDNGRLVDPSDPEALTRAMIELCDPATARDLGDR